MKNIVVIPMTLLVIACSSQESEDLKTSGITAEVNVTTSDTNTSTVEVELLSGSNNNISTELTGGDELFVEANGQREELGKAPSSLGQIIYGTDLDNLSEGTAITIDFERTDGKNAMNSIVTQPQHFDITAPAPLANFTLGETITLTWDASETSDKFTYEGRVSCSNDTETQAENISALAISDDGEFALSAESLAASTQVENPQQCIVDITFNRTNNGTLSSNFDDSGYIRAHLSRSIRFNIVSE